MRVIYRLSAVILFAAGLYGQQGGDAVVVGTVVDTSQAVVQSARVTLTHLATGALIQVLTGERGDYRTPPVRIGEYTIVIEAPGFKRFNQRGLVLDIGDVREVDAVLEVGQTADSVEVVASAPLLQTADSTVGTVINNTQIEDLPLNGRDYLQLAALSSGTVPSTSVVGVSIGGQIGSQTAFLLDGMDNNSQTILPTHGNQKEVIKPSVDAIAEFKVVTNGYAAEFGRSSSGVVSVSIKSGTNQLTVAVDTSSISVCLRDTAHRNSNRAMPGLVVIDPPFALERLAESAAPRTPALPSGRPPRRRRWPAGTTLRDTC